MTFVNIWSTPCRVKATFGIIIANHVDKKVPFWDTKNAGPQVCVFYRTLML